MEPPEPRAFVESVAWTPVRAHADWLEDLKCLRALSEVHDAMSDDLKVLHAALHDVGTGAAGLADATLTAEVSIGITPGGGFVLAVMLDLDPGADEPGRAAELMRAAHAMCRYPRAMPENIDVVLPVRGQSLVEA